MLVKVVASRMQLIVIFGTPEVKAMVFQASVMLLNGVLVKLRKSWYSRVRLSRHVCMVVIGSR